MVVAAEHRHARGRAAGAELFLTRVSLHRRAGRRRAVPLRMGASAHAWFPLAFLLLMIPIPAIIFNQIAFPLQLLASRFGETVLQTLRHPGAARRQRDHARQHAARSGRSVQRHPVAHLAADARHRLRLLHRLAPARCGWSLRSPRFPSRSSPTGCAWRAPAIAAHRYGPEAAQGFFHEFSGWVVFVVSLALMFLIHRAVLAVAPRPRRRRRDLMRLRAVVLTCCLLVTAWYLSPCAGRRGRARARRRYRVAADWPSTVGRGRNAAPFSPQILAILGVDTTSRGRYAAPGDPVRRLVRRLLREPAAGRHDALAAQLSARRGMDADVEGPADHHGDRWRSPGRARVVVNRVVIEKGLDRQLVVVLVPEPRPGRRQRILGEDLHRGRCIGSTGPTPRSCESSRRSATPGGSRRRPPRRAPSQFVQALFPQLAQYLPE